ncbi:hypoxanthine phosphoribosyltransferase [Candidatus Aerophobetes bacterium]|nr:hypoxanthine phosphoribosyltransferase [Candidatus Aerophobetes bacterium]
MSGDLFNPLDKKYFKQVLFEELEIKKRMGELAFEISRDCENKQVVIVGILKGSFMFFSDLVKLLYIHDIHPYIDFMILSSYGSSTVSSGTVQLIKDITTPIEGTFVILVDDILDTGRTLSFARTHLSKLKPEQIKICVFLDKPSRRIVEIKADYSCFTIEDWFVVGYGLDWNNRFRNLPYVAVVNEQNLPGP